MNKIRYQGAGNVWECVVVDEIAKGEFYGKWLSLFA